jgi:hypothetical protein
MSFCTSRGSNRSNKTNFSEKVFILFHISIFDRVLFVLKCENGTLQRCNFVLYTATATCRNPKKEILYYKSIFFYSFLFILTIPNNLALTRYDAPCALEKLDYQVDS